MSSETRTDAALAERCPVDGQSVAWHRHIERDPYDNPRTNGQFIGCDFGEDADEKLERCACGHLAWVEHSGTSMTWNLAPPKGCDNCDCGLTEQQAVEAGRAATPADHPESGERGGA